MARAVRAKSKTVATVPDGVGGFATIQDRRFQKDWAITLEVSQEAADQWLTYLSAEGERRGWSSSSIGQLDGRENSGSITLRDSASGRAQVDIVWFRERGGTMQIRAGLDKDADLTSDDLNELVQRVSAASSAGVTQRFFRAWHLRYDGVPWKGELWLNDSLRLSAPSLQYEGALFGPRIVIVAASIEAITERQAQALFDVKLREVAVFLSVVVGKYFEISPNGGSVWTWSNDAEGAVRTETQNVGYWEKALPTAMPVKGTLSPVPLSPVARPDFERRTLQEEEIHLPHDIFSLWASFDRLSVEKERHFLQVGSLWQAALYLWGKYETTRFALMVGACEAIKPTESRFKEHNIYDVVEALLGRSRVDQLRQHQPQDLRSTHFHTGRFHGSEFTDRAHLANFRDPTFDDASDLVWMTTRACIIAWLANGTQLILPQRKQPAPWRPWLKRNATTLIAGTFGIGVGAGLLLGKMYRR